MIMVWHFPRLRERRMVAGTRTTIPAMNQMPEATCPPWPAPSADSWWQQRAPSPGFAPLAASRTADVIVVGGGVTGCSAALQLARRGADVVLLEARDVAGGASGRNGGFLLAGLAHRPVALAKIVGSQRALELYQLTAAARDRLYATAADIGVADYARQTGSLRLAGDDDDAADLRAEYDLLAGAGIAVELLQPADLPDGLSARFVAGLRFADDGASMPAGWARALAGAAAAAGAHIHEQSPVIDITHTTADDQSPIVTVSTLAAQSVTAPAVIIATEAWTPAVLPELAGHILPYRSQILAAAAPRTSDGAVRRVLSYPTWSRRGWDYAQQTLDGTLVIGGERIEDVSLVRHWQETTCDDDQRWLESWLRDVLDVTPQVIARWAGVLSQTPDGFPWVGPLDQRPGVYVCAGWGGAGNVLGFHCGGLIADLIAGQAADPAAAIPPEFSPSRLGNS